MKLILYFNLVAIVLGYACALDGESALCKTWSAIEGGLLKEFHVTCSKSKDCSAFSCSGIAYGNDINSVIQIHACEDPPSIEYQVNIPKWNVHDFKKIYDNDSVALTKNINLEFEVDWKGKDLTLGLYVHFLNNSSFPLLRRRLPVINHVSFPARCLLSGNDSKPVAQLSVSVRKSISVVSPSSESALLALKGPDEEYNNCSIINSTCGEEEMCKQINKLKPDGICICISNYTRDANGKCIYGQLNEASSVSLLLTAILVPVFVILIVVGAVYASIRFRVCQHLRRRLRVQVYEHVLLGEDDEEDSENPVA